MDWKKGLSFALKGTGAATKVAGALGVPYASMVGSAAAMGAKFLDSKAEKEELESRFKRMSLGITSVQDEIKTNREEMARKYFTSLTRESLQHFEQTFVWDTCRATFHYASIYTIRAFENL